MLYGGYDLSGISYFLLLLTLLLKENARTLFGRRGTAAHSVYVII